ncbi:conserved hypothetical protein [Thermosulfidibacter takaii ABI70S6]|uniref:Probable membrane transporter protein n=1 Tax=Thermosulfidibacter takaii (strain DSM 17441 / JCM 13301 / NBRC 103674 / ABI70S6) TaxID=1298851 RepID=A0A0S3QVF5_THET7|nr:sulfite exporter TauE/SafE family protein [Thermosulfidibacter takaii]BAT72302.1 conserved hypothetical protein [Thermosulfidibacter takaii ABI70S6]
MKFLLLIIAGFIAGVINILAGGGSFLTVSVMIFLGLPPTVANGTNRVAIFLQQLMAVKRFRDFKVLPFRFAFILTLPAALGAVVGSYLAVNISDVLFKKIFAILMITVSFISMLNPKFDRLVEDSIFRWVFLTAGFFLVGIYGGFVQAGVGFFILAVLVLCGFDLVVANAIKVFVIMVFTVFALTMFILKGKVDWAWGLSLAVGNVLGAYVGTGLAVKKGESFIKKVVFIMLVVIAIKLLLT